ncbi:MAG: exodeoxyribonuclease III [Armatimonadota bacterium]
MRIVTANLNGIRSAAKKGFFEWMATTDSDLVCVQELKAQDTDLDTTLRAPGSYTGTFNFAVEKGYSGTGIYWKTEPDTVSTSLGHSLFDDEGRTVEATFGNLVVVSLYLPSASSRDPEEQRIKQVKKDTALEIFAERLRELKASGKQTVVCGDWNIAHTEKDIKNAKGNQKSSGFLPHERAWMGARFDEDGWVDVFRHLYPEEEGLGYTWWSNMPGVFAKNVGWRIDYQVATTELAGSATRAWVYKDQRFSDHSPLIADYDRTFPA